MDRFASSGLGLDRGTVRLVDASWLGWLAEVVRAELAVALTDDATAIEHIGSTAQSASSRNLSSTSLL